MEEEVKASERLRNLQENLSQLAERAQVKRAAEKDKVKAALQEGRADGYHASWRQVANLAQQLEDAERLASTGNPLLDEQRLACPTAFEVLTQFRRLLGRRRRYAEKNPDRSGQAVQHSIDQILHALTWLFPATQTTEPEAASAIN